MMDASSSLNCPYCDTQLAIPPDLWTYSCRQCGKRLDLKSQYAYLRGLDAFSEGQEIYQRIPPKKRRKFLAEDAEALNLFRQAYSSLQVAFTVELEENQRALGVEMMASMTQEFLKRLMTSPLEAQYWNTLMVMQTAQAEYARLTAQLAQVTPGVWEGFLRWRRKSRQKQLTEAILKQEARLDALEQQIEFTEIPRARPKPWKPG